ncbi:MFS general substrate transporter [Xylona heveae TC161]|uniref:MFS general substrate transporter n=1 Tax=Xylona heveae (strain CBS 132557 / TC161) TaxID=1328760 RepID=A0A165I2J6_XYLHT|nr:MFS general substrate transporter [Xylona heveae TC161]KZF24278.1 MFS general substrate transporter [Xylona heveae TC161]
MWMRAWKKQRIELERELDRQPTRPRPERLSLVSPTQQRVLEYSPTQQTHLRGRFISTAQSANLPEMQLFVNPFRKHDVSDFPGVLVPLRDAHRHRSVVTAGDEKLDGIDGKTSPNGANDEEQPHRNSETYSPYTIEGLRAEIAHEVAASGHDSVYDRKSKLINLAIQDIGMGRYNWQLFALCGFGWFADNLWLQGVALTLPSLSAEFGVDTTNVRYTTLATFLGLCIGASVWGIGSDVVGRRLAFNMTLFIAGVFGLAVGGGPNWIGVCGMFSALGTGVGGNLPVDGALFLEFLPMASSGLLTLLSVWWPVGQMIASFFAWAFIPNYSCASDLKSCNLTPPGQPCCGKDNNMGWRYLTFTLGAITFAMFLCRFFLFHLFESPKFLLARGRQSEAVAVVHGLAYKNRTTTWLTEEILDEVGGLSEVKTNTKLSFFQVVERQLTKFSLERIKPLFHTKRLAITTILVWFCWATIGMGYPLFNAFLPQYLANAGSSSGPTPTSVVYRDYVITSVVGVPGSIIGHYTVNIKYVGRKGTMAISTAISGIFLFLFTCSTNSKYQVAFSSLEAFFQNIMYGVLKLTISFTNSTPEVFPAPNRGTGTGIASFLNRVAGFCAPIVAINAGQVNPKAPVYASGGLFLAAFVAMCLLPIETMGKQSL